MDKRAIEHLDLIGPRIQRAVYCGQLKGRSFAEFASDASNVFAGVKVITELVQTSYLARSFDDEDAPAEAALNDYQIDALLSLIRATTDAMHRRASDLSVWAEKRLAEQGDSE